MVDPVDFRRTLGRFATGITVVSMRTEEVTFGITVNAFMSVSLDPPLIAVCIDKKAKAHVTLIDSERFGVSILGAGQEAWSNHFAGRPGPSIADPFEPFHGFPVVREALGQMVCRSYDVADAGDHSMVLGEVEALRSGEGRPLVYYQGRYGSLRDLELSD